MKRAFLFSAVILLCNTGCQKKQPGNGNPATPSYGRSPLVTDANQYFLQEFPTVKFDTMKVEAPAFEETNALHKRLHKDYLPLYPAGFLSENAVDPPLYALSKFSISEKLVGLLIQGAGKRSKTAVTLMIYDHSLGKITSFLEIADHAEDSGYKDRKTTWLFYAGGNFSGFYTLQSRIMPKDENDPTHPISFSENYALKMNGNLLMPKKLTDAEAAKYLKILK